MTMPSHLVRFMVTMLILIIDMWFAAAKGQYIKQSGLGGFAMYEAGGDYNGILVQAITQAMA